MDSEILMPTSNFADFNRRTFVGVVLTGVVVGILTLILSRVIDQYIISPTLCGTTACPNSGELSYHIGATISAIIGVVMLVNLSVYRPLLVAIAVTLGLWSLHSIALVGLAWPLALMMLVVSSVLGYLTFTWILRTYNLPIGLITSVILVLLMNVVIRL